MLVGTNTGNNQIIQEFLSHCRSTTCSRCWYWDAIGDTTECVRNFMREVNNREGGTKDELCEV